uniref:Helicase C-terminal domain-containing protein n=1 Tax=Acrobeloides nanus TaxID=290746 RepID=A0A914EN84_9BILA
MDLFSLIKFLRVKKFSDVTTWTALVGATDPKEIEISKQASSKLNILVQCLMLRRLKTDVDSETKEKILELPENMFEPVDIHMQGLEKEAYDIYLNYNQEKVLQEISGENRQLENQPKMTTKKGISCILELLLRQRQSCNHFYLISDVIGMENMPKLKDKKYVDIFSQNYKSAKLRELLKRIDFIVTVAKDKCVVMTEWRGMLNIIINHLNKLKIKHDVINGDVPAEQRQEIVREFNEPVKKDENGSVLLLTLKTGDVGLNLIGGNHIFIYEMPWNPAIEQQACDRVYRIGQTKPVYTYKPNSKEPKMSKEDYLEIFGLTKVRKN